MSMSVSFNAQPMPLSQLVQSRFLAAQAGDPLITGLCLDSRKVESGNLFCALKGRSTEGHDFAKQAVAAGAVAILAEDQVVHSMELDVPVAVDPDLAKNLSAIAGVFYGKPSETLDVVGITGTNGKTSCSYWLAWMLEQLGTVTGQIGTLGAGLSQENANQDLQPTGFTTPNAIQVQALLAGCKQAGAQTAVMEVSSHGLDQNRVAAVHFNCALFTNLSQDHLDYHANMDDYLQAKIKLFKTDGLKHAIINLDDPVSHRIIDQLGDSVELVSYSLKDAQADLYFTRIQPAAQGYKVGLDGRWGQAQLSLPVFGEYNLSNLLAVAAALLVKNYKFSAVMTALQVVPSVPGRMQSIAVGAGPEIIIDYAHTPDAVKSVLTALRAQTGGRLIAVLGCGGDRDASKRPMMAVAATEHSDRQIFTADNPRGEAVTAIIDDMLSGLDSKAMSTVAVVEDRKRAIRTAVEMASNRDIIAVLGKGHEAFQEVQDQQVPYTDADACRQALLEANP